MQVELDAYSGRPNPVWTLSAEEARALRALLAGAGAAIALPMVVPEGLGYRGFVVRDGGVGKGFEWRVHGGAVARGVEHRADIGGAEAWLITFARSRGHGAIFGP